MGRSVVRRLSLILVAMSAWTGALAAATETREFAILVAGKQAGDCTMTIVDADDGTTTMKAVVSVKVPGILFPYSYSCEVHETWRGDRLARAVAFSVENGRKTAVSVSAENDRVAVSVDGQRRNVTWDVWTASFWKLADRRFHNQEVPILEPDTGKDFKGKLDYVGVERIKVGAEVDDCYRFRVTGIPSPTDLWFDRHHRLVRQEFTDSGQKTIVQLMHRKVAK